MTFADTLDTFRKELAQALLAFPELENRVTEDDTHIHILTKKQTPFIGIYLFEYHKKGVRTFSYSKTNRVGAKVFNEFVNVFLEKKVRFPVFNPTKNSLDPKNVAKKIFDFYLKYKEIALKAMEVIQAKNTELEGIQIPPFVLLKRDEDGLYSIQITKRHPAEVIKKILKAWA